jgi:hypothetical protein
MREIRTSGSMSGDGKRGVGHRPQATAPILDSTFAPSRPAARHVRERCIHRAEAGPGNDDPGLTSSRGVHVGTGVARAALERPVSRPG